ncbi:MAG: hypothetical protein LM555_02795 [Desulfurococcaceae archaeon]|nr:hypothetical protein [Desulfurococcaceae archaeon]
MNRLALRLLQVALLLCFYIVPYAALPGARGLELFTAWTALTLLAGVVSIIELWRRR